ncbi:NAD(P)H-dependent oxidoreductase [Psittacicella hinzii]|nr:NAD(P)H-dependent oxidoreductase [Psittacicella hinzii]
MKTLVIASHPYYANSQVIKALVDTARQTPDVEVRMID